MRRKAAVKRQHAAYTGLNPFQSETYGIVHVDVACL